VRTFGFVLWFVALGLAAWVIVWNRRQERAAIEVSRPRATVTPSSPLPALDDEQMWR
jgi:hypothetical protein